MKKLVVYLCAGMLVLGLTACGGDEQNNTPDHDMQIENTAEETPESTEEPVSTKGPAATTTDMSIFRQAVVDVLGENYIPNTEVTADYLEEYGLTSDMYDAFFGEVPMISVNVDTMIIIRAKDGQLDAVEEVVNNYREALVNDAMVYPMNVGKVQASRIETFGDYVCFVQLGADTSTYGENGDEEAIIKHCQEQNELALEAIGKVISQ